MHISTWKQPLCIAWFFVHPSDKVQEAIIAGHILYTVASIYNVTISGTIWPMKMKTPNYSSTLQEQFLCYGYLHHTCSVGVVWLHVLYNI